MPSTNYVYDDITLPGTKVDVAGAGDGFAANQIITASEFNNLKSLVSDLRTSVRTGLMRPLSPVNPISNAGESNYRVDTDGRVWVSANAQKYTPITKELGYYDIRQHGALPGQANKVVTRQAFDEIFTEINAKYNSGGSDTQGLSAVIYVPFSRSGWWLDQGVSYLGSYSKKILFIGDGPGNANDLGGSSLFYDGAAGGTFFDFVAINQSRFEGIKFNGGRLAKNIIKVRQYFHAGSPNTMIGASTIDFVDCWFIDPGSYSDSALILCGQDDDPPNTLACDTLNFDRCYFWGLDAGSSSLQGYGFKAVVGGNTKRFNFRSCHFNYLYRGIEGYSGDLNLTDVVFASIGGYYRAGGTNVYWGGNTFLWNGGGSENIANGWCARHAIFGQGVNAKITGCYLNAVLPADDFGIVAAGGTTLECNEFQSNARSASTMAPWRASTQVNMDEDITNDSGKAYRCITAGITAGSVGPTGTSSNITDGAAHWKYMGSAVGKTTKFQIDASLKGSSTGGFGGVRIVNNLITSNPGTTMTAVPLFDSSGNHLGGNVMNENGWGGDYARNSPHSVEMFGNSTGVFGGGDTYNHPLRDVGDIGLECRVDGTPSGVTLMRHESGISTLRVPYTVLKAGSGTSSQRTIRLCDLPAGAGILETYCNVKTAFAGPAADFTLGLGWHQDPSVDNLAAFLKDTAATSLVVVGAAGADLGTLFAAKAQASYVPDRAGQIQVFLVLKSAGAGITGITAGSVDVTIKWGWAA